MPSKTIKVLIVCAMGFTSSMIEENVIKAAERRGLSVELKSRGTGGIEDFIQSYLPHVVLFAPQTAFMRRQLEPLVSSAGGKCATVDNMAYATADGEAVLDTILKSVEGAGGNLK